MKIKNKAEEAAVQAVFQAADDDARIAAANALLAKHADSDYKALALFMAANAYQGKGDFENMIVFCERTIEADPKFYACHLQIAQSLAQRTKEFDFDKEEKLGRAEKLAKEALGLVKDAAKMNPAIPDEQWMTMKKDFESQAHETLGMAAAVRKKHDVAVEEFKLAVELQDKKDPATAVRLAQSYIALSKWDDALALLDKIKDDPNAHPTVKQIASQERVKAILAKQKAAAPAK
jgi:tetratricopeptide (TPR) repeat protein